MLGAALVRADARVPMVVTAPATAALAASLPTNVRRDSMLRPPVANCFLPHSRATTAAHKQ